MGNKIKHKYFCIGGKHQNFNVNLNRIIPYSAVALVGLFGLMLFPVSFVMDSTEAAPVQSTTTLTLSTSDISVEITPNSIGGTFSASDLATVSVTTNNYSGYTLGITSSDNVNNTKLTNTSDNTAYLTSISSASSADDFNTNNWGYLPSKLNGVANSAYQPAPTTTATTLEATNAANSTANEYTIALGAKADYSLPSGTYENSFTLTAVANPVNYTITYNKNTEDTVENMPENQSGSIEDTDITISNTTPTREHYTFQGWCTTTPTTSNGVDSCSGTTYQPGVTYNTNKTTANSLTLRAIWKVNTYAQTTRVRYEVANADGTYGSYTIVDTKDVKYGDTYSWSTSQISGFDSATYSSASVTAYTVTEANTNSVNVTRRSYKLTITRNTGYATIASVSGAGTYKVGKVVAISATATAGSSFSSWTQTAGTTSSFGSTSSASTTFTMPASAATIKANGTVNTRYMQNYTTAGCPTSATIVYDVRDNTAYHIQKLADGKCWMLDNLALDLTNSTVKSKLTASTTNASATTLNYLKNGGGTTSDKYAITGVGNWTSGSSGSYSAPLINMASKDVVPNDAPANSAGYNKIGGYYNFCAASAGSYCYGNGTSGGIPSGNATEDICAAGWRMPTNSATKSAPAGEYQDLANSILSGSPKFYDEAWEEVGEPWWYYTGDNFTTYRRVLSLPFSGWGRNGNFGAGSTGVFWSNTKGGSSTMFALEFEKSGSELITAGYHFVRDDGVSVRCVTK